MDFSRRLIQLREEKGWTKTDTAKKIGVSTGAYANWEYGNREPDLKLINKISTVFGVSMSYLIDDDQEAILKATEILQLPAWKEAVFMSDMIQKVREPLTVSYLSVKDAKLIPAPNESEEVIEKQRNSLMTIISETIDKIDDINN